TLTAVDFTNDDMGREGARLLSESLKNNNTLNTLKLRGNRIGDDGTKFIADILCCAYDSDTDKKISGNNTLMTLDISNNDIT
nr:hypothetical protein [Alphaproteobacteria bacterium]